jgi:hypothetical protein
MEALAAGSRAVALPVCSRVFISTGEGQRMAHSSEPAPAEGAAYHGEVWTDGRGFATVHLPADAGPLEPPLEYELRDLDPPGTARVTAELENGRFTIETGEPHVKVAWRISGRPATGHAPHPQQEEE